MLSNQDYEKYLNQIEEIESRMRKIYEELSRKVEDRDIQNTFKALAQSESQHESLVKGITELFRKVLKKD